MLDKLKKLMNASKPEKKEQASTDPKAEIAKGDEPEDMMEETGTFMLDMDKLKELEDLDDLLKDV